MAFADAQGGFVAANYRQGNDNADGLGYCGAEGGACRSHIQGADEQIVQGDVENAGDGNEIHGALGISQAAENRTDDIIGCDERNADKANFQIGDCTRNRFGRCGNQ